jgi:hypothetical protein
MATPSPTLTVQCGQYLAKRFQTPPTDCTPDLLALLQSPKKINGCVAASGTGNKVSCLDARGVISLTNKLPQLLTPFQVAPSTNCTLCDAQGFRPSCRVRLDLILTDIAAQADLGACSTAYYDQVITYMLRYQPELVCSSTLTYGHPKSPVGTLVGVLDMRATTQCGVCAAVPCLPGQLCLANKPGEWVGGVG